MIDVDELFNQLNDRFTAEELCEVLGLTVEDLFNEFLERIVEIDWSEYV